MTAGADVPRAHGMLAVGDGNRLYWEEWGDPAGVPALYLHGGPGGGLRDSGYRTRFDLERTRLIGFDQRGCGRSTPHVADPTVPLAANTTAHLITDIEALRRHLGVEWWIVNGVSWGSTLALAYALAHPERVRGLVLYAVTTTSRREVDWITEGVGAIFPEAWDCLAGHAEDAGIGYRRGRGRLIEAYHRLIEAPDPEVREAASREWALWEDTHVSLAAGGVRRNRRWADPRFRLAMTRLVTWYWAHDGFLAPPILDRAGELGGLPGHLIHGRRDISGPAVTAWELHRAWPGSRLCIDDGDGHGGPSMGQRWLDANRELLSGE